MPTKTWGACPGCGKKFHDKKVFKQHWKDRKNPNSECSQLVKEARFVFAYLVQFEIFATLLTLQYFSKVSKDYYLIIVQAIVDSCKQRISFVKQMLGEKMPKHWAQSLYRSDEAIELELSNNVTKELAEYEPLRFSDYYRMAICFNLSTFNRIDKYFSNYNLPKSLTLADIDYDKANIKRIKFLVSKLVYCVPKIFLPSIRTLVRFKKPETFAAIYKMCVMGSSNAVESASELQSACLEPMFGIIHPNALLYLSMINASRYDRLSQTSLSQTKPRIGKKQENRIKILHDKKRLIRELLVYTNEKAKNGETVQKDILTIYFKVQKTSTQIDYLEIACDDIIKYTNTHGMIEARDIKLTSLLGLLLDRIGNDQTTIVDGLGEILPHILREVIYDFFVNSPSYTFDQSVSQDKTKTSKIYLSDLDELLIDEKESAILIEHLPSAQPGYPMHISAIQMGATLP